jgi:hypothetical protein
MPAEDRFGLLFKGPPVLEFAATVGINSTSAGWSTESIRAILPKIDNTTLNSLSKEKFCPDECTFRGDTTPLSSRTIEICKFDSKVSMAFWWFVFACYFAASVGLICYLLHLAGVGELIRDFKRETNRISAV